MQYKPLSLILAALLIFATPAAALVNGEAPAEDDKRFDAVAAFSKTNWLIDNPEDKHVNNWFGNGVLIAPDVVLIAKHLLPNNGRAGLDAGAHAIRFRRHKDGSLGSVKEGPGSYYQVTIGKWIVADRFDLALGILAEPVEHIKPVPVLLKSDGFEKQAGVLAGWGSQSPWRGNAGPRTELRIGENSLTAMNSFIRVNEYKVELRDDDKGVKKQYIIEENAVPNMHDSGGSIFVLNDKGEPVLAGIISTYTGGTFLPAAAEAGFPIEAATRGGKALVEAVEAIEAVESAE